MSTKSKISLGTSPPSKVNKLSFRKPLPGVSLTQSQASPSYGRFALIGTVADNATNLERYQVRDKNGAVTVVSSRDVFRYVSASEVERFDCAQIQRRKEQEAADRQALLAARQLKRPQGRLPKAKHHALLTSNTVAERPSISSTRTSSQESRVEPSLIKSAQAQDGASPSTTSSRSSRSRGIQYVVPSPSANSAGSAARSTATWRNYKSVSPDMAFQKNEASQKRPADFDDNRKSKSPRIQKDKAWATSGKQDDDAAAVEQTTSIRSIQQAKNVTVDAEMGNDEMAVDGMADEESANEEYEVEGILDDYVVDGQRYYLVKWVGYEEVTQEPPENLQDAKEILDSYLLQKRGRAMNAARRTS